MPPVTDKMKYHISEFEDKKKNIIGNKMSPQKGALKFNMGLTNNSNKELKIMQEIKRELSPDKMPSPNKMSSPFKMGADLSESENKKQLNKGAMGHFTENNVI
jgi:hypothetical protein